MGLALGPMQSCFRRPDRPRPKCHQPPSREARPSPTAVGQNSPLGSSSDHAALCGPDPMCRGWIRGGTWGSVRGSGSPTRQCPRPRKGGGPRGPQLGPLAS